MIKYFKAAYEMAQSENWNESSAQELISDMSEEYKRYLEKKRQVAGGNEVKYPVDLFLEFETGGRKEGEIEKVRPLIFDPEHYEEDRKAFEKSSREVAKLLSEA